MRTIFILWLFVLFVPQSGWAVVCPAVPPLPDSTEQDPDFQNRWEGVDEPRMARYAVKPGAEPAYGIGYLELLNEDAFYYDWPRHVVLPLWLKPDEAAFYGWLQQGRVNPVDNPAAYPLTGAGLVETGYENSNFIVYQALADGWLRIRLKPGSDGEAWTHRCHLATGNVRLAYREWQLFLAEHGDWLHFRSRVPHALREQPDINSRRVTLIGLDHKLVLREFHGDWMRVTVEQPDYTCSSLPDMELQGTLHEGWVKWRDADIGPWVWVYTRGC